MEGVPSMVELAVPLVFGAHSEEQVASVVEEFVVELLFVAGCLQTLQVRSPQGDKQGNRESDLF